MKQVPRILATITIVFNLFCFSRSAVEAQRRPPNIVVIVTDDMGYADIGVHGSKDIPTPNIDALAKVGIRFTDAYVSGPYCSPTRAGLLTSRYPQRFGHEFNLDLSPAHSDFGLPLGETTMADRLKVAGYRTTVFGKWHLGSGDKFHPMARGFDEFFGFLGGGHSYLDAQAASRNPLLDGRKVLAETTYLTDAFADRAVDFIKRQKSQPFFLYLAFNAVHTPLQATSKYLARFTHIADEQRRTYAAMLSAMDDGIGKTLAALRAEGLEENTLIFFFNDNGGPTMAGTAINGSSNAPLRGSKRQTWEGGIRVVFIIRWKGHLAEGRTDTRPIIQLDVLPTALAAAGVKPQPQWKLDGVNLLPFLTGKMSGRPHEALYWRLGENMAIRKGDWKLVKTSERPLQDVDPGVFNDLSGAELYNLADDIGEKMNLAAAHPEKVKELGAAWQRWNKELVKPLWPPGAREGGAAGQQ
ncbi:MAG: sulfatase [Acidobacteriota bacterium]|nr:sulfatase [Acidobacteriota bacterium]